MENWFKAQVIVEPVSVWLLELISQMKGKTRYKLPPRKKQPSLQFSIDNCSQESRAGSKTSFYNRFFEWRKFLKKKKWFFWSKFALWSQPVFQISPFLFWVSCTFNKSYTWVENWRYRGPFFLPKSLLNQNFKGYTLLCFIVFLPIRFFKFPRGSLFYSPTVCIPPFSPVK